MPTTTAALLLLLVLLLCFKAVTPFISGCDYGTIVNSYSEATSLNLFTAQPITFTFNYGNQYACHENFYGTASNTVLSKSSCTTSFWFRCCPLKGYQNADANCVGKAIGTLSASTPVNGKCPWLTSNSVACSVCPNALPSNAQWLTYCVWTCQNGFQYDGNNGCMCPATSYVNAAGTCVPCSAISNGVISTAAGINAASCVYTCNYGYQWTSGTLCTPCSGTPSNAQIIAAGSCSFVCNAGYTWSYTACVPCPFNQYRAFSYTDQGCTQATPNPLACSAGQYYVMSPTDGSFSSCAQCTPVAANAYYFVRDAQTQYTGNIAARDQCYSASCSVPSTAGTYTAGCGGVSPGYTAQCTTINLASGTDCRYYLVQAQNTDPVCPTASCTSCGAGYYNALCPAKTQAAAITAGNCLSVCAAVLHATSVASTIGGADCPFQCNSGYYLYQGSCAACLGDSSSCPPGYYRPTYCNPVTGANAACTGVCTYLQYQSPKTSLPIIGSGACQWQCSPGSYKLSTSAPQIPTFSVSMGSLRVGVSSGSTTVSQCVACSVSSITCAAGQYILAYCLTQYDATAPPSCDSCILDPNAVATGPSPVVMDPKQCPIACNAGYWQKSTGSCTAWTATGASCTAAGMYWGGGTSTADNACVSCPPAGQPAPYPSNAFPSVNIWPNPGKSCAWACIAGAYLDIQHNYCVQCPRGTYQPTNGISPVSCTTCPAGYYCPGGAGAQTYLQPPDFSTVSADNSSFSCNAGYTQITSIYQPTRCQACLLAPSFAALNMSSLNFDSQCAIVNFTCLPGFYRNASSSIASSRSSFFVAQSVACTPCPLASGAITISTAWAAQQALATVVQACGGYPACNCPLDERQLACAPQQCSPGYFANRSKPCPASSVSDSTMMFCQACAAVTCAAGTTLMLCQGAQQTSNQCVQCPLAPSQQTQGFVWISGCSWGCTFGYYNASSSSACLTCAAGTYQSKTNYTGSACASCAAGYYLGASGGSACLACAPGSYSSVPKSTACVGCPSGYQSPAYSATACSVCPAGTFAAAGGTACLLCPAATPYSIAASTACSVPPPPCPVGFFYLSSSSSCVACPSGFYCPFVNGPYLNCPWGTPPSAPLSSASTQCTTTSQSCAYRTSNLIVSCPPNTTNVNSGGNSALWCHPKQGYYGLRGQPASLCPLDSYCPLVATAPIPCPAGMFAVEGSVSCATYMLPPCRPGWYLPFQATQCSQCPIGSYCYNSQIFACDASSVTMAWLTASTQSTSSAACIQAPSAPVQCPSNTLPVYASSYLQCRAAPGYYFIPGTSAATICPAGYYCPAAALQPVPCPAATCMLMGYTQIVATCPRGASVPLDPCVPCTNQPLSGAFSYTTVASCAYCCNAGYYYLAQNGICAPQPTACPAAFSYMPQFPACSTTTTTNTLQCAACPAAPSNGVPMSSLPNVYSNQACAYACNAGYYPSSTDCLACPAGTYSLALASACSACPARAYSPQAASSQCYTCGTYGYPPSPAAARCACVGGAYYNTSANDCLPCPAGAVPLNEYTCTMCLAGTVVGPVNDAIQAPCLAGGYRASQRLFTCTPCDAGSFSAANETTACTLCPAGTYAASAGQSACSPCPLGTTVGSTACVPASPCSSPYSSYYDALSGACATCASRCAANNAAVLPLTPGACTTNPITTAADFTCVCPSGWYGDGFSTAPCARCANMSQCICPSGSYFSVADQACRPCRTCPSTAVSIMSPCLSGSTADTTVCVCPRLHYFMAGLCVPCGVCPPGATAVTVCAAGSTADNTVCACGAGSSGSLGNGVVCF